MDLIQGTHESGAGLAFSTIDISVWNSASTLNRRMYGGEVVYLSFTGKDGTASVTSSYAQNPSLNGAGTQQNIHGFWGVILDPMIEIGQLGKARVKGPVKARVIDSTSGTAALTVGTGLVSLPASAIYNGAVRLDVKGFSGTGTTTRKIVGVVMESTTSTPETEFSTVSTSSMTSSGNTYGNTLVLFDGINGFGGANGE